MRKLALLVAATVMTVSSPVMAQSTGERILRGVIGQLLGEEEQPAQEEEQVEQPVMIDMTPMEAALKHERRDEDRARDVYRHPEQTINFFRIEPGMTVVDYMPAGGWYARIMIPYLGRNGTYIGLNPRLDDRFATGGYWDLYRNASTRIPNEAGSWVGIEGARVYGLNTDDEMDNWEGVADRVTIFREIHNMRRFGWFHESMVAIRHLLKDDGLVGVVQHRARAKAPVSYVLGDNGYQKQDDVVALFALYGFELVDSSEINANPRDPANWETGVWSLPPSYIGAREGTSEYRRRTQIGESDRMTLLFRKVQ